MYKVATHRVPVGDGHEEVGQRRQIGDALVDGHREVVLVKRWGVVVHVAHRYSDRCVCRCERVVAIRTIRFNFSCLKKIKITMY